MAGVGGAAVPGRLSLAGTEARPTELFSYKVAVKKVRIGGTGFQPVQARAFACGYQKLPYDCDLVEKEKAT